MSKTDIDRCCCTCGRNQRIPDKDGNMDCICTIDGHTIGYVQSFEYSCRQYALDDAYKPK